MWGSKKTEKKNWVYIVPGATMEKKIKKTQVAPGTKYGVFRYFQKTNIRIIIIFEISPVKSQKMYKNKMQKQKNRLFRKRKDVKACALKQIKF